MTIKFSLNPNPTFKAKAAIAVPGADKPSLVEFVFKHRGRAAQQEFLDSLKVTEGEEPKKDIDVVMDVASGWELVEAFNRENVEKLLDNYPSAANAIMETYYAELSAARIKN